MAAFPLLVFVTGFEIRPDDHFARGVAALGVGEGVMLLLVRLGGSNSNMDGSWAHLGLRH